MLKVVDTLGTEDDCGGVEWWWRGILMLEGDVPKFGSCSFGPAGDNGVLICVVFDDMVLVEKTLQPALQSLPMPMRELENEDMMWHWWTGRLVSWRLQEADELWVCPDAESMWITGAVGMILVFGAVRVR